MFFTEEGRVLNFAAHRRVLNVSVRATQVDSSKWPVIVTVASSYEVAARESDGFCALANAPAHP